MQNTSQIRTLTERITNQLTCMVDHLQEQRALRDLSKTGTLSARPSSVLCAACSCALKSNIACDNILLCRLWNCRAIL